VPVAGGAVERPRGRLVGLAVLAVLALTVNVAAGVLARPDGWGSALVAGSVGLPFVAVGIVVLRRFPRHAIGWSLVTAGLLGATGELATLVGADATPRAVVLAAWYSEWYWVPMVVLIFVLIPLWFPTGRLPSAGWRPLLWVVVAATLQAVVAAMLQGELAVGSPAGAEGAAPTVPNPLGLAPWPEMEEALPGVVLFSVLLPAVGLAVVSLVVRFRAAGHRERLQLKWGALGAGGVATAFLLQATTDVLFEVRLPGLVEQLVLWALPVSFGIAILRSRLYEIDRILSRSVAYLLLSLALLAVYAGSVVALQPVLRPLTGTSDLAVAVSTLLVAASFGPIRRRIQAAVDRRFNRRRFAQVETVARFGARLRDEVELETVSQALRSVTVSTLEPSVVTVWLRANPRP
jgi:hypothetical protein